MVNGFAIIFLFFVVIAITAALFVGWVIVAIVRGILGGIFHLLFGSAKPTRASPLPVDLRHCVRPGCAAANPADARFCRRCGAELPAPQRVAVRRAAVW